MKWVTDIEALEALYGAPGQPSLRKVANQMTPLYRKDYGFAPVCLKHGGTKWHGWQPTR